MPRVRRVVKQTKSAARAHPALLLLLLAACDTPPASAPDAAPADVRDVGDAQAASDHFPSDPLCANEVALPAVSGDDACALEVPALDGASLDLTKVNIVLRIGGARAVLFDHVADAAACGGLQAWHYDDARDPSQLLLCPQACTLAGSDPDSQVQLLVGCDTRCAETNLRCAAGHAHE